MAPSIIYNHAVQGEVFLLGQIFMFGGFALRANSLGHLEQIDSYALIRLQRIYNFLLFHAIILPLLDVYGLYFTHLYHFWD